MNINDKIKQILIEKNVTPSYFADEIGVQRSSISHILSGRNRPSFDIIQKIIRRFPELGYEWIMEEDNHQSANASTLLTPPRYSSPNGGRTNAGPTHSFPNQSPTTLPSASYSAPAGGAGVRSASAPRHEIPADTPSFGEATKAKTGGESISVVENGTEKKAERILIFYTDGSFREYTLATS